jgi:hypothetical protein
VERLRIVCHGDESKVVLYVCTHFAQNDYQSVGPVSKLSDRLATNEIEQMHSHNIYVSEIDKVSGLD